MPLHGWIALAILVGATVLFTTRRVPLEAAALAIPLLLWATGTVPEADLALAGFGNQVVIALAAMFVLGAALQESGVGELMARGLGRLGGGEARVVALVCLSVALLSGFMSNAATLAVMLPGVTAVSQRSGVPLGRLLMPAAFAAVLGGNLTVVGTVPNLLVSEHLRAASGAGFGMFEFAAVGVPIVVAGVTTVALVARRLLPSSTPKDRLLRGGLPARLASQYGLARNLTRLKVGPTSKLQGHTLGELELARRYDVVVVLIGRREGLGLQWHVPLSDLRLQIGDDLYLEGETEALWTLAEEQQTRIGLTGQHHVEAVLDQGIRLAEVLVGPRSTAIGKTLREAGFRRHFRVSVLTLWRGDEKLAKGLSTTPLAMGDTLLVAGDERALQRLAESPDFVLLGGDVSGRDLRKAPLALAILALAVLPAVLGLAPLAMSALLGALLALLTGCVTRRDALQSIEWPVLALIAGTLPLGLALERHGVAAKGAEILLAGTAGLAPAWTLAALFGAAAAVSLATSNAAAAVILAPVAGAVALQAGLPERTALLAVVYGCSCAFVAPFSQCNLMVASPGGYRARDFLRAGSLLSLVVAAVAVALLARAA